MRIGLFTDVYLPYVSGVVTAVDTLRLALEKLQYVGSSNIWYLEYASFYHNSLIIRTTEY